VYEQVVAGARLFALNIDTHVARVLRAALPPLAHDFSVDEARERVVYTLGVPGTERWEIIETRTDTGESRVLAAGASVAQLPTVLPDGRVASCPGPGQGLVDVASGAQVLPARGPGFERCASFRRGSPLGCTRCHQASPSPSRCR
jgi:hypothetical protein